MFLIISTIAIIIVGIVILGIYNSKVEVEIKNLDISTQREKPNIINDNYEIIVSLAIFNKWKIIKLKIRKDKIKEIRKSKIIKRLDTKFLKNKKVQKGITKRIKELQIEIKKIEMYIEIGTEDAALTAISVGVVSSIIGILLKDQITMNDKFEIQPIYMQKNLINLKLNCIFRIDLMHYIYKNIFKERGKKNERKPSNRRAYAYSNE